MREHSLRPIGTAVWAACASKLYICVFFLCVASLTSLRAQTLPLSHGERVDYDLYFKWGLIMSKAGLATLSVKESEYQGAPSWHYNLLFRSAGVIRWIVITQRSLGSCSARSARTRETTIWWIISSLSIKEAVGSISTRIAIH